MDNITTQEFHRSVMKSMIIVGLVTLVSMISAKYTVHYLLSDHSPTPIYTSHDSQISSK